MFRLHMHLKRRATRKSYLAYLAFHSLIRVRSLVAYQAATMAKTTSTVVALEGHFARMKALMRLKIILSSELLTTFVALKLQRICMSLLMPLEMGVRSESLAAYETFVRSFGLYDRQMLVHFLNRSKDVVAMVADQNWKIIIGILFNLMVM